MKDIAVCGIANGILDLLVKVTEKELTTLELEKGTMRLVTQDEQKALLSKIQDDEPKLSSGGSVANSIIAASQLGAKTGLITCLGDDRYGLFYVNESETLGIELGQAPLVGETTGTCISLVTPDAERTMRTCLGASSKLSARHVNEELIARSEWLFIEGYVIANPDNGPSTVLEALRCAKKHGTKVAFTFSEAFVVDVFRSVAEEIVKNADLVFANASEACAFVQVDSVKDAFAKLKSLVPGVVVSSGAEGAFISFGGTEGHVPAFKCVPLDLTGAGDMLAGAFLYGVTHGYAPLDAARGACYLAMQVITQIGARLPHGVRQHWDLQVGTAQASNL